MMYWPNLNCFPGVLRGARRLGLGPACQRYGHLDGYLHVRARLLCEAETVTSDHGEPLLIRERFSSGASRA